MHALKQEAKEIEQGDKGPKCKAAMKNEGCQEEKMEFFPVAVIGAPSTVP